MSTSLVYYNAFYDSSSDFTIYSGLADNANLLLYKENSDGSQAYAKVYSGIKIPKLGSVISSDNSAIYAMKESAGMNIVKINTSDGSLSTKYTR